jgi:hypothetical protein
LRIFLVDVELTQNCDEAHASDSTGDEPLVLSRRTRL